MSIKIHYSFVFYIVILFFLNLLTYFSIFLFFILIHECTHGFFGLLFGLKIKSIDISIGGLCLEFENFNISLFKKIIILLSGPAINLVLAIIFIYFNKERYIFFILTNSFLFLFNMIPIFPLDGGKIIFEIFTEYFKQNQSVQIIKNIYYIFTTIIVCIAAYVSVNFYNNQLFLIGIYLLIQSNKNNYKNVMII